MLPAVAAPCGPCSLRSLLLACGTRQLRSPTLPPFEPFAWGKGHPHRREQVLQDAAARLRQGQQALHHLQVVGPRGRRGGQRLGRRLVAVGSRQPKPQARARVPAGRCAQGAPRTTALSHTFSRLLSLSLSHVLSPYPTFSRLIRPSLAFSDLPSPSPRPNSASSRASTSSPASRRCRPRAGTCPRSITFLRLPSPSIPFHRLPSLSIPFHSGTT